MAKIVSTIFSSMRGSIAGTTFLTTPSGQIIARQRTKPVNPSSTYQTVIRNSLAASVAAWEALSHEDRTLWDAYADTLGSGKSGRQIFIGNYSLAVYGNLRESGLITPGDAPPTNPGVLEIQNVSVGTYVGPGTGFAVSFTNLSTDDAVLLIERSNAVSPARYFWKGPWLSSTFDLQAIAGEASGNYEFSGLVEDSWYFARLRFLTDEEPLRSSAVYILRAQAETVGP